MPARTMWKEGRGAEGGSASGGGGVPFCSVLCTEGAAAAAVTGDGHSKLLWSSREGHGQVITAVSFYKTTYTLAN